MIDGTLIVLFLALGLSALGRHLYRRGWHAGRAALLREQWLRTANRIEETNGGRLTNVRFTVFDQEADA